MKKNRAQWFIKRCFDVFLSFIGIIALMPFLLLISILIVLTSKGPAIFVQERPGKNKKIFKIYKFRTMKPGSDRMIKGKEVLNDDDRVTKLGAILRRLKLDELPQLFNILKGNMSLIGPRPERIASLEDYDEEISKRLNVRPGITGLAQVSGNIYLDLLDRYKMDVYYTENFSLRLDIRIFFRTVFVVLLGEKRFKNKPLIINRR